MAESTDSVPKRVSAKTSVSTAEGTSGREGTRKICPGAASAGGAKLRSPSATAAPPKGAEGSCKLSRPELGLDTERRLRASAFLFFGALLSLATGPEDAAEVPRHRGQLASRILRRIESDYADTDLSPKTVAAQVGISKRYLQTLLAASGTSFVQELNATRLDRASEMLADKRLAALAIADVAYRSGFLDPAYFTRLFRKRFGITPREWRAGNAPQS